jgi:hypothetical protein
MAKNAEKGLAPRISHEKMSEMALNSQRDEMKMAFLKRKGR